MRSALVFTAFSWVFAALIAGCPELPEPVLCGRIPAGGCPAGRGGSCDDAICEALYDCVDGAWTATERCDDRDAGSTSDGGDAGPTIDGGPCTQVMIDTSAEAFPCKPDLQDPDCPVAAAMGCAESVCFTGCSDFYLCTTGGWTAVAYCTDDGDLVITQ